MIQISTMTGNYPPRREGFKGSFHLVKLDFFSPNTVFWHFLFCTIFVYVVYCQLSEGSQPCYAGVQRF